MTISAIEVYEIFKAHLKESDARTITSFISEVKEMDIDTVVDKKIEHLATKDELSHAVERLDKTIANLATKTELYNSVAKLEKTIENLATKAELEKTVENLVTKAEFEKSNTNMIKWMFIFWVGQMIATVALVLLFLK